MAQNRKPKLSFCHQHRGHVGTANPPEITEVGTLFASGLGLKLGKWLSGFCQEMTTETHGIRIAFRMAKYDQL
jgi:hypothetical protein